MELNQTTKCPIMPKETANDFLNKHEMTIIGISPCLSLPANAKRDIGMGKFN
jgi:hypothetical protein